MKNERSIKCIPPTITPVVDFVHCTRDTRVYTRTAGFCRGYSYQNRDSQKGPGAEAIKRFTFTSSFLCYPVEGQGMMRFPKETRDCPQRGRERVPSLLPPLPPFSSFASFLFFHAVATLPFIPPQRLRLPLHGPVCRSRSHVSPLKIIILRLIVGRNRDERGHSSGALDAAIASPDFRANIVATCTDERVSLIRGRYTVNGRTRALVRGKNGLPGEGRMPPVSPVPERN